MSVAKRSLIGSTAKPKSQTSKTESNPLKTNSLAAHSMKKKKYNPAAIHFAKKS